MINISGYNPIQRFLSLPAVSTLCTLAVRLTLLDETMERRGERGAGESTILDCAGGDTVLTVENVPACAGTDNEADSVIVAVSVVCSSNCD